MAPPHPPQPSMKRIKTLSVSCPIIYGNTARLLTDAEKTPEIIASSHTHTWTVFVHHPTLDDSLLAPYIKKVSFKLHDTYNNSLRVIEEQPFQVTESGWGEFDIVIKIHFTQETGEKMVQFNHRLQLHPYDIQRQLLAEQKKEDQIIRSIQYDEIVFNEPTEVLFEKLTARPGNLLPEKLSLDKNTPFSRQLEKQEIHRLNAANAKVKTQIMNLRKNIVEKTKGEIGKNTANFVP